MNKNKKAALRSRAHLLLQAGLTGIALTLLSAAALAQRGAIQPAAHAGQQPINNLPNPYETQRNFGTRTGGAGAR